MRRYIAFLRAINVGGHTVTMETLRGVFEKLGLADVESFIASGNIIFGTRAPEVGALERTIEAQLQKALGFEVKTFLRTDAEVAAVARYQPFSPKQLAAARTLNIGFLSAPLTPAATKALMAFTTDIDSFHAEAREVYWLCKKGQSESDFSNVRFEKALKVSATFRGANTIARLAAKYPGGDQRLEA